MVTIAVAIIIGFISAALSTFIDFCFNKGNILYWYMKFIVTRLYYNLKWNGRYFERRPIKKWKRYLFKAIGGCIFCFNTHVTWIMYILVTMDLSLPASITGLIISIGASFFALRFIKYKLGI